MMIILGSWVVGSLLLTWAASRAARNLTPTPQPPARPELKLVRE